MEARDSRVEKLERILRELMEIYALALTPQGDQFRMWLDLAILETWSQIEKIQLETVH